jgi:hypothetical protein
MSVHIGELHTDVSSVDTGSAPGGHDRGRAKDAGEEQEREARRRREWLECRVAAEGFDD